MSESHDQKPPLELPDNVSPYDAIAAKTLRGLFTNRIYIRNDGLNIRMQFGEYVEGDPIYHSAIVVPIADAVAFGKLISDISLRALLELPQVTANVIQGAQQVMDLPDNQDV